MGTRNVVHKNAYFDSVALMRVAAQLNDQDGVDAASLMMGTDANRDLLEDAGLLTDDGTLAGPNDLIVAVRGEDAAADAALEAASSALNGPPAADAPHTDSAAPAVRRLAAAPPDTNLALISTPGRYAAAEALKALNRGMHAFIFSDNVPLDQEITLKQLATERGLLVMGPDCGTAIINGHPLGFANAVRPGDVGLIGASGTGLQQVSSLLHTLGAGVSQAIGVGSHDLSSEVGGLSMLSAFDALDADPATAVIVLLSKPPAAAVAEAVLERAARSQKRVVVNFLGATVQAPRPSVVVAATLREAALAAAELSLGTRARPEPAPEAAGLADGMGARNLLRGLYAGGTFAYEAAVLLEPQIGELTKTAGYAPGVTPELPAEHTVLDLGDDQFTAGRPHPMIDPSTRVEFLRAAVADPRTAVVILDIVIGHGAADDPVGPLAPVIAEATAASGGPIVIAYVVGTSADPQNMAAQSDALRQAGAVVVDSSTTAVEVAADILTKIGETR
ncbi:MAG TPA: acyl-CoA synthetase FdrA [Nocardioidaceae bacterium]|nr:acyl-CoA synthetase FdrA [Nocardioidaceae bacterium]